MNNFDIFLCKDSNDNDCIFIGKSDIKSAFHLLPLKKSSWCWLIMMAKNPKTGNGNFLLINACHLVQVSVVLISSNFQCLETLATIQDNDEIDQQLFGRFPFCGCYSTSL